MRSSERRTGSTAENGQFETPALPFSMSELADFATFGSDHTYGRSWSSPVNHLTAAYVGRASLYQMRALTNRSSYACSPKRNCPTLHRRRSLRFPTRVGKRTRPERFAIEMKFKRGQRPMGTRIPQGHCRIAVSSSPVQPASREAAQWRVRSRRWSGTPRCHRAHTRRQTASGSAQRG